MMIMMMLKMTLMMTTLLFTNINRIFYLTSTMKK